jgi:hypothetical protein
MRPSSVLCAKADADQGAIVLGSVSIDDSIRFHGSSLPVSATPGERSSFITVAAPESGKTGIVAITVRGGPRGKNNLPSYQRDFILRVSNEDEKGPWIDLDDSWVPPADRLGQIEEHYRIIVRCSDEGVEKVFVSKGRHKDTRPVVSGNLLCQFMTGQVILEQVMHEAEEVEAEESARNRVAELERSYEERGHEIAMVEGERDSLGRQLAESRDKVRTIRHEYDLLETTALRLYEAGLRQWFKSGTLKRALESVPSRVERRFLGTK